MEWDQFIFKKISQAVKAVRRKELSPIEIDNRVSLEHIKPRLTYLAQMLCGVRIHIHAAEKIGGWKGNTFFLPEYYSRGLDRERNIDYYLFRIFFLYGQFRLEQFWRENEGKSEAESYLQAQEKANEVLTYLYNEYPALEQLYHRVVDAELDYQKNTENISSPYLNWVYGRWYSMDAQDHAAYIELINPIKKNTIAQPKNQEDYSEVKGKNIEEVKLLQVNTQEQEQYTMTHNFEKIETLDSFSGRWRDFDGSDEMDEHSEALQEVNMQQMVRVDSPVHSIYKSDYVHSLGMMDADMDIREFHFSYPEWNEYKKIYRENYCQIIYNQSIEQNKDWVNIVLKKRKKEIQQLKKKSEYYLRDLYVKKRTNDGEDPDLDAVVDAYVDRKTDNIPSEALYISKRKKAKDIAILVLVDASLSADGYVQNRRVLDIEREALIIAAEVWSDFDLKFQIDTFGSHTHSQCFYSTVKAFHEDWAQAKNKIGGIQAKGYTRIGAAMRHATYILDNLKVENKWLLLLSDGKPNDYDTYEGDYGIYDVKKAFVEASQKGINVSAIAIDDKAKFYFPKMFGLSGYQILHQSEDLPELLTRFYIQFLK